MARSRSPAWVARVLSRWPLRKAVRASVCSFHSAPIRPLSSASISSCSIRSATLRTSSIPSAVRSDSSRRCRSDWDKATGTSWVELAVHQGDLHGGLPYAQGAEAVIGCTPRAHARAHLNRDRLHHHAGRHRAPDASGVESDAQGALTAALDAHPAGRLLAAGGASHRHTMVDGPPGNSPKTPCCSAAHGSSTRVRFTIRSSCCWRSPSRRGAGSRAGRANPPARSARWSQRLGGLQVRRGWSG
ncbi:hypothetical protein QFZ74_000670 [Streptomyces sp. V3I7]|nr:hypothetical protein [Streptomyces sp. V3I7]